jgi:plasmid maintenance system antidote protein VapI
MNDSLNFRGFQERLRANLRLRVSTGEVTERGLARLSGVSQPHIHNVLKGKREFSPDMADRIMQSLRMDLLELLQAHEILDWRRRR